MRAHVFVFLALAGLAADPAFAQTASRAAAATAAPSERKFDDWLSRCVTSKSNTACEIVQAAVDEKQKRSILVTSIAFVPAKNSHFAQFVVPLGVSLADGAYMDVDGVRSPKLVYRRCLKEGCVIEGKIDSGMLTSLQNGQKASLEVKGYRSKKIDLPLSLKGFSAALADMEARAKAASP